MPNPVHCINHIIQQYLNFSNLLSVNSNEKSNVSFKSTSWVIISKFRYYFSYITFVSLRCWWNHCRFSAYPRQQLSENLIRRITSNNFSHANILFICSNIYLPSVIKKKFFLMAQGWCSIYTEEGTSSTLNHRDNRWHKMLY